MKKLIIKYTISILFICGIITCVWAMYVYPWAKSVAGAGDSASIGSLVAGVIANGKFDVLVLFLFGWGVSLLVGTGLYLYKALYEPLKKLKKAIEQAENDEFKPIDYGLCYNQWRQLFTKVNCIYGKLADTTTTLQMLFSASKTLTSTVEINEIFQTVLAIILKKFEGVSCSVLILGEDGFLRIKNNQGLSPDFVRSVHMKPGEGYAGRAFQECQTVLVNNVDTERSILTPDALEQEGIKAFIYIPLVVESRCVGLLNANSDKENYFIEDRIRTLSTLGEYLSIGLRNAKLYERIREYNRRLGVEISSTTRELIQTNSRLIQKAREMKALSDIAASAASKINLPEIFDMIVDKIKEILSAQAAGFFLYSKDTNDMAPCYPFFGVRDHDFTNLRFKLNEVKILDAIVREGNYFMLNNTQQAKNALPILSSMLTVYSLLLVPLRSGSNVIGALGVVNKYGSPFNKDDLRILELIADRISGIIENVRLYQELEQRLHDLTSLQEISSAISSEPVLSQTLKKVISTATKAFNADLCALVLYNEETHELVTQPGAHFVGGDELVLLRIPADNENSITADVYRSGKPFLSADVSIDPLVKGQTFRHWDIRSLILIPLKAENRVIGVLEIGRHQANCYKKDNLRLAGLIAHQAAIIIENARLYDSVREAKEELERLNQVKNEFISIVSHELRTPITAIKGFVKLVLKGEVGGVNPQQKKFLNIADQSIDRLIVLIAELLDISRIESGKIKLKLGPVNAKELVRTVLLNVSAESYGKHIDITSSLPAKLPLIMADYNRLSQVFDNLIINGIKFTPNDGKITISAQDKGDFVLFSVKDTGIGIAEKDQDKIFEKFYRVDLPLNRVVTGAGLGLSIVKSIIEIHGGNIWVESKPNCGSCFRFMIPRAKTEIKNFHMN